MPRKKDYLDWLNEAIGSGAMSKASELIRSYLERNIGTKFILYPEPEQFKNSAMAGFGIRYFFGRSSIRFNWKNTNFNSSSLHSVDLWVKAGGAPTWSVEFDSEVSLATALPYVVELLQRGNIKPESDVLLAENHYSSFSDQLLFEDRYDDIIEFLSASRGKSFSMGHVNSTYALRGADIVRKLRSAYPEQFEERGRDISYIGSDADVNNLRRAKARDMKAMGARSVRVKPGVPGAEEYIPSKDVVAFEKDAPRLAFTQQVKDLEKLVKLVVPPVNANNALIVCGRGGLGKTYNVEQGLKKAGLSEGQGYFKVTGSVSAAGLFRLLYKHRNSVLLFDDSDDVFGDQTSRNLLKAALDDKPVRRLVWNKMSKDMYDPDAEGDPDDDDEDDRIPRWFEYTGQIIFISNLPLNTLDKDGAIRTRALYSDFDPTAKEVWDFIDEIRDYIPVADGIVLSSRNRQEVLELLRENVRGNTITLRTVARAYNIMGGTLASGGGDWKHFVKNYI